MESEDSIPNWLAKKFDELCPGFLADEKQYLARHPNEASLTPVRLGHWIDEHIFSFAQQGGWLLAITFYAVRESRYQKASVCWSESVEKWRKARPIQYPLFEQWRREAAQCDETAHLLPRVRKERVCFALVDPERLAQAVARFIEWEAFAYWVRLPLEKGDCFPIELTRELNSRCPGFVEFNNQERSADRHIPQDWHRLMSWVGDHFFQEAQREGWYDAILISARNHPRAIRTMEYCAITLNRSGSLNCPRPIQRLRPGGEMPIAMWISPIRRTLALTLISNSVCQTAQNLLTNFRTGGRPLSCLSLCGAFHLKEVFSRLPQFRLSSSSPDASSYIAR